MSLSPRTKILLLDGYNIMRRVAELNIDPATKLEKQRDDFARQIASWQRTHGFRGRIYIIFDGRESVSRGKDYDTLHGITCIYSHLKEEADGRILSIVRGAEKPEEIAVVSDDNEIINNARALGASVQPASLFNPEQKSARKPGSKPHGEGKQIDQATAHSINAHLKKIWNIT